MRCRFRRVHRAGGHPQKAPAGVRAEAYAALRFRTLCEMREERGMIAAPCYRRFRNDSDFAVAGLARIVTLSFRFCDDSAVIVAGYLAKSLSLRGGDAAVAIHSGFSLFRMF